MEGQARLRRPARPDPAECLGQSGAEAVVRLDSDAPQEGRVRLAVVVTQSVPPAEPAAIAGAPAH